MVFKWVVYQSATPLTLVTTDCQKACEIESYLGGNHILRRPWSIANSTTNAVEYCSISWQCCLIVHRLSAEAACDFACCFAVSRIEIFFADCKYGTISHRYIPYEDTQQNIISTSYSFSLAYLHNCKDYEYKLILWTRFISLNSFHCICSPNLSLSLLSSISEIVWSS